MRALKQLDPFSRYSAWFLSCSPFRDSHSRILPRREQALNPLPRNGTGKTILTSRLEPGEPNCRGSSVP